jgi:hypothetical protein
MSLLDNPFIKGYWGLEARRTLQVSRDGNPRSVYFPLHPSQAHWHDREIVLRPCIVCNGYAISATRQTLSEALTALCNEHGSEQGFVEGVRYTIHADDNGQDVRLGDVDSSEKADTIINRMKFEAGFYSRCWEISPAHLEKEAVGYLQRVAHRAEPLDFFSVFNLVCGRVGVHLSHAPFDNAPSAAELFARGMPLSLARLLYLAVEADVRILIFAHGAPRLNVLPTFSHD